jgi:Fe-Mn family superoxide dismutase
MIDKKLEELLKKSVTQTLQEKNVLGKYSKVNESTKNNKALLTEAYVAQPTKFNLNTELLSDKTKTTHQELFEGYIKELNATSAELDTADRENVNPNHSQFRSLKMDETHNHNASFLHGLYFQNISDVNSEISADSLAFMRLERDFGSFDLWQEDFVACCMAARNGWAMTVYSFNLKRYINTVIDLHDQHVMVSTFPVIVMDCWEHSYFKDYLKNRKAYVYGMMKELNWDIIEQRFKVADKIGALL